MVSLATMRSPDAARPSSSRSCGPRILAGHSLRGHRDLGTLGPRSWRTDCSRPRRVPHVWGGGMVREAPRGRTPAGAGRRRSVGAQVGNERIDLGCLVTSGGQPPHLCQASGGEPVVLSARLDQLSVDEASTDGQEGEGVDLLVPLEKLAPDVVAVQAQGVGKLPGQPNVLEGQQHEQHCLVGTGREGDQHVSMVVGPPVAHGPVQTCRRGGGGPAPEDMHPGLGRVVRPVPLEESAPVVGCLE